MRGFVADDGRLVAEIDGPFAGAMARLADQIADQISRRLAPQDTRDLDAIVRRAESGDQTALDPDDDLARLNPPVSREDPERAAEFRRWTIGDLDRERVERLRWLAGGLRGSRRSLLRPVWLAIEPDEAGRMAAALNDLRLVLAQRLDIQDAEAAEAVYEHAQSNSPGAIYSVLYLVASALQDSLIEQLMGADGSDGEGTPEGDAGR